jgi:hypothetical protein
MEARRTKKASEGDPKGRHRPRHHVPTKVGERAPLQGRPRVERRPRLSTTPLHPASYWADVLARAHAQAAQAQEGGAGAGKKRRRKAVRASLEGRGELVRVRVGSGAKELWTFPLQPDAKHHYGGQGLARESAWLNFEDSGWVQEYERLFLEHVDFGSRSNAFRKAVKKARDNDMLWRVQLREKKKSQQAHQQGEEEELVEEMPEGEMPDAQEAAVAAEEETRRSRQEVRKEQAAQKAAAGAAAALVHAPTKARKAYPTGPSAASLQLQSMQDRVMETYKKNRAAASKGQQRPEDITLGVMRRQQPAPGAGAGGSSGDFVAVPRSASKSAKAVKKNMDRFD